MSVIEAVDRAAFVDRVSAAEPMFEKQFGRSEIDRIRSAAAAARRDGKAIPNQVLPNQALQ